MGSTGKKQSVTVRSSGGLSDAEIERMVQEAESMRESDSKKKEGVQVKNDSETLCYQVEKQLSELKAKMKDLQEVSWKVTQQAYQQASSEESGSGSEEKAKDSKFEEEKKEEKK